MNKDRLVVLYNHLLVGGIENYVIELFKASYETGKELYWICHDNYLVADVYKKDITKYGVKTITKKEFYAKDGFGLRNYSSGRTIVITFAFFDYIEGVKLFRTLPEEKSSVLLLIPHFKGYSIFPENIFKGSVLNYAKRVVKNIYERSIGNNCILFFNARHAEIVEDNYDLKIEKVQIVQGLHEKEPFNESEVEQRYNSPAFTIVSAGRFEFPHKGYLIGLIKLFGQLKEKYPQLRLLIIGDGRNKEMVENTIRELPQYVQNAIEIHPSVSLTELQHIYKECNLSVSVAGCVCESGKVGLVSLPARHYTYDCEVYGFFPESRYSTTDDREGYPAMPYIEKVINATKEEYIKLSREAYESFVPNTIDKEYLFKLDSHIIRLSKKETIQLNIIKILQSIAFRMGNKQV